MDPGGLTAEKKVKTHMQTQEAEEDLNLISCFP